MSPSPSHILPDLTGEFIDDGELHLLCLLGSGAYGKVYKALDTSSLADAPEYYAVKCMPRYEPGSRDARIQENELMIHRMVTGHPRVITFYRQFSTDEFVFVVLELSTGGDFFHALAERECFRGNPALIKKAFGELLDAVEYCHRNSVYHRDLKPENILCNSAGTDIRLADFGLATQLAVTTQFGCGSRFYMSPESIDRAYSNGCYSARHSDLWALSVIFTNMICGRHPWGSADLSDPCFAAFRSDNNYLSRALKITRPASALLKRCFHMNPLRRPTLEQFRDAVNDIDFFSLADVVVPVPPTPPIIPVVPSMSLEWVVASAVVASEAGGFETPRPTFPARMPTPIQFTLGSCSSLSSSRSLVFLPPSSASSSSPPSTPSSSVPSASTASDSSAPATPATFPVDATRACSILDLTADSGATPLPALPPRAHLGKPRPAFHCPIPSYPNEYRTVADKGRPTLPTRRKFFGARFLGRGQVVVEN